MATVSTERNPPVGRAPEPWRRVLLPIEHGSWSLVLEPVLLALACGGALPAAGVALLGCGVQLARRPARMLAGGAGPSLGRCLVGVACAALLATGGLILLARGAGGCWSWAWVAGGAALFMPFIHLVGGFLVGVLLAMVYNLASRWTGGIEIVVKDE